MGDHESRPEMCRPPDDRNGRGVVTVGTVLRWEYFAALVKLGYMLETPSIRRYSPPLGGSDNARGADNQQGSRSLGELTPQRPHAEAR